MSVLITKAANHRQENWDQFVAGCSEATVYQSFHALTVFSETYNHKFTPLIASSGDQVTGILPLLHVKSVFGSYCCSLPGGPLTTDPETEAALIERACEIAGETRANALQLRELNTECAASQLETRRTETTFVAPLGKAGDQLWDDLDGRCRRAVRKSEKSEIEVDTGLNNLEEFYKVYSVNMRNLGTPAIPKRFFLKMKELMPQAIRLIVAKREGRVIAAVLIGTANPTKHELLFSCSLNEFRQFSPNDAIYWAALKHAADAGCSEFDFGRSAPDSGVAQFKRKWGAQEQPLYYQFYKPTGKKIPVTNPRTDKRFTAVSWVWRKLPVPVATRLSPLIRNYVPLG